MQKAVGWDTLLEHLFDGALLVGPGGELVSWNAPAAAMLGLSASIRASDPARATPPELFDAHGNPLAGGAGPIAATLADGRSRDLDGFARHAAGHLVPIKVRTAAVPPSQGGPGATVVLLRDDSEKTILRRQADDLREQALIDHATGAASRLFVELQLVSRLAEIERYGWPFAAMLVAIDDWPGLAKRYGEVHRREFVKLVADSLLNAARSSDLIGCWGEGEFLVLLANVGDPTLLTGAERFRRVIEQGQHQAYGEGARVTVSVGATSARKNDSVGVLVARVNALVAKSRAAGGNCVSLGS
jgi:diguanylate cyclase (GGDEF)-like protein